MNKKGYEGKIAFMIFGLLVLVISATTSFSFFYEYFGDIIPSSLMGESLRRIISGVIGTLLFDVATVVWLWVYLNEAETYEQRGISIAMAIVAFAGAAAATIAYLSLTAAGPLAFDATTNSAIGNIALAVVIIGVVFNFAAKQLFDRYSFDSKAAVREANRRDKIQKAENEQADYLDDLVTKGVKENLQGLAPVIADEQARSLAGKFYGKEMVKYHNPGFANIANDEEEPDPKVERVTDESEVTPKPAKSKISVDRPRQKKCAYCGNTFPWSAKRKYCNDSCRTNASKKRRRKNYHSNKGG